LLPYSDSWTYPFHTHSPISKYHYNLMTYIIYSQTWRNFISSWRWSMVSIRVWIKLYKIWIS
jgi:hypothetical protein